MPYGISIVTLGAMRPICVSMDEMLILCHAAKVKVVTFMSFEDI